MNKPHPFVDFFPNVYPEQRAVFPDREPGLVGVMIKSVMYHAADETLLCRALVVYARDVELRTTVHLRVTGIAPVVGYDCDLICDQDGEEETWDLVRKKWSRYFASEPVSARVFHMDIMRQVNAWIFPFARVSLARRYIETVRGALTFGDFCPNKGYYVARDGNTPALCSNVMYGRVYFVPGDKLNGTLSASELVYDHGLSEAEAQLFDSKHEPYFYRAACLDIETVYGDKPFRDPDLRSESFAYRFPYCTERKIEDMRIRRNALVAAIGALKHLAKDSRKDIKIPPLASDLSGQQHEITCLSLVLLNTHVPKTSAARHRKRLVVLYNKFKASKGSKPPRADHELAARAGLDDVKRMEIFPCSGELELLETALGLLRLHGVDLLYVYNADFDIRVIQQRVHFYAESEYARNSDPATKKRCDALLRTWRGLFVTKALAENAQPLLQFENVRYLEMYNKLLDSLGPLLLKERLTQNDVLLASALISDFNKEKAKLCHLKINTCGMNIVDLYRVAGTREVKFACTSMKLNDVAPFLIDKYRALLGKPRKDPRKTQKLADVSYPRMDEMTALGGESLFAVLVYALVDSHLCARMVKVLRPASALFHRCRTTLNLDAVVHGRGETFDGFVQSIHSVQLPQLKFTLDTLRVKAGPSGKVLNARLRLDSEPLSDWKGGAVCEPLTGLHFSGPGMPMEISFDFTSMYPSTMCALNISPETTIPWPPSKSPHDLSGWVCYHWEAEGFQYASLILKYDESRGEFVRVPGVVAASVEYYLNTRAEHKAKVADPLVTESERDYYKVQERECKIMANAFYGTAGPPCGPLISAHGRHQISAVNGCVSTFFRHRCPVVYGDTDSVMVSAGYGPEDPAEEDVPNVDVKPSDRGAEEDDAALPGFARRARIAVEEKLKRSRAQVREFLSYVHKHLVEDTLARMFVIGRGNCHQRLFRDPGKTFTSQGYPVYLAAVSGSRTPVDVTTPFVKNRRVKLEYENSGSIYCHVAKKAYLTLAHNLDSQGRLSSTSVKIRGLSAFKSVHSPSDSAIADVFVACAIRGDCVKLETDQVSCFSTHPWHRLRTGDVILYAKREPLVDDLGRWLDLGEARSFLVPYRVEDVRVLQLDSNFSAVSAKLVSAEERRGSEGDRLVVRTLYQDGKYCMNHVFSRKEAILRDLLVCKASEFISSRIGAGFFPWSGLIKSAKNKSFSRQTLERFGVGHSSVRTSYMEIVKTHLKDITGLLVAPVKCYEFHKCNPCEAAFCRYPLDIKGVKSSLFGAQLRCLNKRSEARCSEERIERAELSSELVAHPYQPANKCFSDSRVLVAHSADLALMNSNMKLVPHCVVDYCLPRHMYTRALRDGCLSDCEKHLLEYVASVENRLLRATEVFHSVMNNCPEYMIPACGARDSARLKANIETLVRIPERKLEVCRKVIVEDMGLRHRDVYGNLSATLGCKLNQAMVDGAVSIAQEEDRDLEEEDNVSSRSDATVKLRVPSRMLIDAGFRVSSNYCKLSVPRRSEQFERHLVDLAGIIYRTALVLQLHAPEVFRSPHVMYPESALTIVPYSCAEENHVRTWMESFKDRKWLKDVRPGLGKRRGSGEREENAVTYHCHGCKNFYRDLALNGVPGNRFLQTVYGQDKKRKIGRCVNEARV